MIGGKVDVLKQIVDAFEILADSVTDDSQLDGLPDVHYDSEPETISLMYGRGHSLAVYTVSVERRY